MASTPKAPGKDINAFRASHDKNFIVPKKIEEGLKALGQDKWEYQEDFRKLCGVTVTDLALFRESFADYWLEISGKTKKLIWCGSKGLATKLRAMV